MQKLMKSLIVAFAYMSMPIMAQKTDLVNPIIGTNGMGHTFPGACAPFGIVQVSPDTDTIPHNIDGAAFAYSVQLMLTRLQFAGSSLWRMLRLLQP